MKWPVREGLLAVVARMKEDAYIDFKHAQLMYGLGVGKKPQLPDILKER